jgi:hypothetical protein
MANAGITLLVASGDGGSLGWNNAATAGAQGALGAALDEPHVAYPASDPWVTSCGGTTLGVTVGSTTITRDQEWIWNDTSAGGIPGATGGGISAYFTARPPWQVGVVSQMGKNPGNTGSGRGVPDVAGNASLNSGYQVSLSGIPIPPLGQGGQEPTPSGPFCGTSAVAPLYAGLVAMINAKLGYPIGFLNPTLYAFRDTVCRYINDQDPAFAGEAPPLDNQLSGTAAPGYPSGSGGLNWDACTGLGVILPAALLAAIQQNFYFVVDKSTFGVDEVTDNPSWPSTFWLFLEGFSPSTVAGAKPNLGGTFTTNIPGLSISLPTITYDGSDVNQAQRIRFSYDVQFTTSGLDSSLGAFPAAGQETYLSLSATITIQGQVLPLTPMTEIELVGGADPYFTNVNPDQGNYFYLSQDLRVFTITAGTTVGAGTGAPTLGPGGVPAAYAFIQGLIANLNQQYGYLNTDSSYVPSDNPDPLDSVNVLPSQTGALTGDSTVTPGTSGQPYYNFAIARVRLKGPISDTNTNGVVESPENCDKLAQRNLQITPSGNPGFPATHLIPQTFDLRPSPAKGPSTGCLAGYPDELMIDWGDVPIGSIARIYWPAVSSADVLALAARLYPSHPLSAADAHTVQCKVTSGVSFVPIPSGGDQSFAGLLTVQLPAGIRVGNEFDVVVRRITTRRPVERDDVDILAARGRPIVDWRYIVGTFTVRIPVQHEHTILPEEESLLSILKWRLTLVPPSDRWYPVLLRYVDYVSARVNGMGGNAGAIPAVPGYYPTPAPKPGHGSLGHKHGYTGKVSGLRYDRFGDFEGFLLETKDGEERTFESTESAVEALVRHAWEDRILLTVFVDRHHPERVVSIVLRRAPPPPW